MRPDLEYKWELMAADAFVLFRGTYYRWLETIDAIAPELDGPVVGVVGDLHVENFGTWGVKKKTRRRGTARVGRQRLRRERGAPYTYDLARLATSAALGDRRGEEDQARA